MEVWVLSNDAILSLGACFSKGNYYILADTIYLPIHKKIQPDSPVAYASPTDLLDKIIPGTWARKVKA